MKFIIIIKKYRIIEENIYNFDGKKFIIGVNIIAAQVITSEKIRKKEIISVNQDKNRGCVTLLAAIYDIAIKILFVLIYQSRDLRNSLIDNICKIK